VLSRQPRLETLLADEAGKAVLEAHIPEVLAEAGWVAGDKVPGLQSCAP
jgi:hypothetical protein